MIDDDGFIALIAAIVARARRDAHHPSGNDLGDGQRAELQQEAKDFLRWVDAQREELANLAASAATPAPLPGRHTHGGSLRWEMTADLRTRARRKREQTNGTGRAPGSDNALGHRRGRVAWPKARDCNEREYRYE